jgi:polysaccharide export outer membrane protein
MWSPRGKNAFRYLFTLVLFSLALIVDTNAFNLMAQDGDRADTFPQDRFFQNQQKIFPPGFQSRTPRFDNEKITFSGQVAGDYPVGPGDTFLINFWGRIEDNLVISIDNEGKLFIPKIGVIETTGLTYTDLTKSIEEKIKKHLKNVNFKIAITETRSFHVYVLGSVTEPGPFQVQASSRASEVIRKAGGPLPTGSKQFIEIRRNGEVIRVDTLAFSSFGDFSKNPYLMDGDVVFVPVLSDFVTVSGAVVFPGVFEIRETKALTKVIESLGGYTIYADRTAPLLLSRRNQDGSRRKLEVIMDSSKPSRMGPQQVSGENFDLQNGDEIFVPAAALLIPSNSEAVFVTGAVRAPGPKAFQVAGSVDEYIGAAGGLTDRANYSGAMLYRADGSEVPLTRRMAIQPGDTIHIPEKTFKFWQDHLAIMTTLISLATSIIVLSGR